MKSHPKLLSLSFSVIALFILPCLLPEASALAAPPPNDNFANAQVITGMLTFGTNVEATKQPGEPNHANNTGGKSVWYKWTAPRNLGITFDTLDSVLNDTLLAVYTGTSVNALTLVASNDDWSSINGGPQSRVFFPAVAGTVYYIAVDGFNGESAALRVRQEINRSPSRGTDVDGINIDEITVFRPMNGTWYFSLNGGNGGVSSRHFGQSGDVPVPADYDGDGRTDLAVFRPSNGTWYVLRSNSNSMLSVQFGLNGDIPTPGEYTSDGYADIAVFRPSNGRWYIRMSNGILITKHFGQNGDKPAPNDYDGDGKIDLAVFRPSTGHWYILNSFDNSIRGVYWGQAGDIPVPGDYGSQFDGKADVAVFRPSNGTWYVLSSTDNSLMAVTWGLAGDIPQPMNTKNGTDESRISDFAVYRPSNGTWYFLDSIDGSIKAVQWGSASGDIPASSSFVVQP